MLRSRHRSSLGGSRCILLPSIAGTGVFFGSANSPPQACLFRVRIAVIARIERHSRFSDKPHQSPDRILQHPPFRLVCPSHADAGVDNGHGLQKCRFPFRRPPSRSASGKMRAWRRTENSVDWLGSHLEQSHVASIGERINDSHVVSSVAVRLGPRSCSTAQVQDDSFLRHPSPLAAMLASMASAKVEPFNAFFALMCHHFVVDKG